MKKLFIAVISVLLISGCATKIDRGSFRESVRTNNDKPHGYLVIADPTGSAPTPYIEKFEVRHGDCGGSRDWNDCTNDRERSEIYTGSDNYEGDEYWYGWSLYLPSDFPNLYPVVQTLGQFKNDEGCITFAFEKSWRGLIIDRQAGVAPDCRAQQEVQLLTEQELLGKWNKFEIHAKWSKKEDGYFDVYINDELKYNYKGKTSYKTLLNQKYGVYRSFLSRYCCRKEAPTQIAYYANVKRAKTREGLSP